MRIVQLVLSRHCKRQLVHRENCLQVLDLNKTKQCYDGKTKGYIKYIIRFNFLYMYINSSMKIQVHNQIVLILKSTLCYYKIGKHNILYSFAEQPTKSTEPKTLFCMSIWLYGIHNISNGLIPPFTNLSLTEGK